MPVYKDEQRNTWYVKYKTKTWDNKVKEIKKRGFKTKREAQEWELESKRSSAGTLNMTIQSFAKIYINNCSARIKESTLETKRNIIEKQILPYLGNIELDKLSTKDIISWQNRLLQFKDPKSGEPFKKSYLKTVHNQLSAMINHAVRYYDLQKNPAAIVGNMGNDKEIKMNFLTKDEYQKVSEELMDDPMHYYAVEVLYWAGAREGEMLALTPKDIDFKNSEINIDKTFNHVNGKDIVTSPKTRTSVRKVKIPKFLVDELKEYMEMIYEPQEDQRLFPTNKSNLTNAFKRALRKAGIKKNIRIHDLRHSHVSLLIDMGYSAVAIAERVGHKSIDITYRYAHLFPNASNKIAENLNSIKEEIND